jgi:hypothetical protein
VSPSRSRIPVLTQCHEGAEQTDRDPEEGKGTPVRVLSEADSEQLRYPEDSDDEG